MHKDTQKYILQNKNKYKLIDVQTVIHVNSFDDKIHDKNTYKKRHKNA